MIAPVVDRSARGGLLARVLENWSITTPVEQSARMLDVLHDAYLRHVPFENATKLIKAARVMAPDAAVRGPVEFWEDHIRWGSGGTCFASNYAYQFLLRYLGFSSRLVFCQLPAERVDAHVALVVEVEGASWLVDVGYALPAVIPIPDSGTGRRITPYYDIEIRTGPGGEHLVFSEDDRGQRFRYRFQLRGIADPEYLLAWHRTFHPRAPYMRRLALGRFRSPVRFLYKDPGRVYEISRAGEQSLSLEASAASLAGFFQLPAPLVDAALVSLERLVAI